MRYLFFDIECANCFNGEGKICSVGYCIVDQFFNIIKVEDVLINPRSKFNLGPRNKEPIIQLGYTKNKFNKSPDFNERYQKLRDLLEHKDQIIFGHSVGNDLSFLLSEFKRYKKEQFYIKAYDTQAIYKQIKAIDKDIGLGTLCEIYNVETENLHRSDCDSVMTMKVLKEICKEQNLTLSELLNIYPNTFAELKDGGVYKIFEPVKKSKLLANYNKELYNDCHAKKGHPIIKLIAFDDVLEEQEFKKTMKYVEIINKAGFYAYTSRIPKANYYVLKDENSIKSIRVKNRIANSKQKIQILTEAQFIKKFKICNDILNIKDEEES